MKLSVQGQKTHTAKGTGLFTSEPFETLSVSRDVETHVDDRYGDSDAFGGTIHSLQLRLKKRTDGAPPKK